jgi:hypothetical protein
MPFRGTSMRLYRNVEISESAQEIWELSVVERPMRPIKNFATAAERVSHLLAGRLTRRIGGGREGP